MQDTFDASCQEVFEEVLSVAPPELRHCVRQSGLVVRGMDRPPQALQSALGISRSDEMVAVSVDSRLGDLFSLGIPVTSEQDVVILFREGIEAASPSREGEIRSTLIHELSSHFGFGDEVVEAWESASLFTFDSCELPS